MSTQPPTELPAPQPITESMLPLSEAKKGDKGELRGWAALATGLRKIVEKTCKAEDSDERRRHRKWRENWLFEDGRQIGAWNDDGDGTVWEDGDEDARFQFYINNHFSSFIETRQKEWARSQIKLTASAFRNNAHAEGAARKGAEILKREEKRIETPAMHLAEGLTAEMCGIYFRHTYFSTKYGHKVQVPQIEMQTQQMADGAMECAECQMQADRQQFDQALTEPALQEPSLLGQQPSQPAGLGQSMPAQATPTSPQSPSVLPAALPSPQMGAAETIATAPTCPQCGSTMVTELPPVEVEMPTVVGYEEKTAGETMTDFVDPFEMTVDMRGRMGQIKTCLWIRRDRRIHKSILRGTYGNKMFASADNWFSSGLGDQRQLERSAGSMSGGTSSSRRYNTMDDDDYAVLTEVWLDKPLYQDEFVDIDTQLVNGDTIPMGTPLGEVFPDGLYIALVGHLMVDLRNENKNDHWTAAVGRVMPTSFYGRGAEDAVNQQKLLNDAYNLMIHWLRYCTSSPLIVDAELGLDANSFSSIPGDTTFTQGRNTEQPIGNSIYQVPTPQMPNSIPMFIENAKGDMQKQLGAFSAISGAPDIDISTATGIKMMREAAVAGIAMMLLLKAQMKVEWGEQVLKSAQENWVFEHPVEKKDEFGRVEIEWFTQVDIDEDLAVSYEEGSVTPRSEIEERNDLAEQGALFGVPGGRWNPDLPIDMRRAAQKVYGGDAGMSEYQQNQRKSQIRLDDMLELIGTLQSSMAEAGLPQEPDPMTGVAPAEVFALQQIPMILEAVPIDPLMDDHKACMEFYKHYAQTDAFLFDADDLTKEVIRARYQEHMQAMVMVAQMEMSAQVAIQGPAMMAEGAGGGAPQAGGKSPNTKPPDNKKKETGANANDMMRK